MGGRSRGTSPILNYGPSATTAQRGTTICGSEADRPHLSARCTFAPTNSISVRSRSGFDGCWSALLDLCAGKMTHPIDQPATWRQLRAREAAPNQDRAGSAPLLSTGAANSRPVTAVRCPRFPAPLKRLLWMGSGSPAGIERAALVGSDAPGLAKRAYVTLEQSPCLLVACSQRTSLCRRSPCETHR
jgi:hypothetical protein